MDLFIFLELFILLFKLTDLLYLPVLKHVRSREELCLAAQQLFSLCILSFNPAIPVGPFIYGYFGNHIGQVGPVCPVYPVNPVGPVCPVWPMRPVNPVGPVCPVYPV